MFQIDLLKGKARPYRTNLKKVVLRLMLLLIPIGATVVYAVDLSCDRMELSKLRHTYATHESKLEDYAADIQFLMGLRNRINDVSVLLSEAGQAMHYRQVTSDILVEVAQQLPPNIFLQEMNWNRIFRREQKTDDKTGERRFEPVVQRSIKLSLCGSEGDNSDKAVQAYLGCLGTSPVVSPLVQEVRPPARRQREWEGKNATVYEVEFLLKDQR